MANDKPKLSRGRGGEDPIDENRVKLKVAWIGVVSAVVAAVVAALLTWRLNAYREVWTFTIDKVEISNIASKGDEKPGDLVCDGTLTITVGQQKFEFEMEVKNGIWGGVALAREGSS